MTDPAASRVRASQSPRDEATPPESSGTPQLDDLFVDWVIEHCSIVEYVWSEKRAAWCPEWWKHPEAVERLWVLWLARTQAYANDDDLGAASSWWLQHWDRHAPILFDARLGPFRHCDRQLGHRHEQDGDETPPVAAERPPLGWQRHVGEHGFLQ